MKAIVAASYETAMEAAAKLAPAKYFHRLCKRKSEEQFLGAPLPPQQAAGLADQSIAAKTV